MVTEHEDLALKIEMNFTNDSQAINSHPRYFVTVGHFCMKPRDCTYIHTHFSKVLCASRLSLASHSMTRNHLDWKAGLSPIQLPLE